MILYKKCNKCLRDKPLICFHKKKQAKDGLTSHCKDCSKEYSQNYYIENKDKVKLITKKYFENNKEKVHIRHRQYNKAYYENNKQEVNKKRNEYEKNRKKNDIHFLLRKRLRTRLASAIRDDVKSGSAISDLGCSIEEFKSYLESKFTEGMNWDNRLEWHIDHIIPLASVDLTDREQLLKVCHYTNLQPLWIKDHISKSIVDMENIHSV